MKSGESKITAKILDWLNKIPNGRFVKLSDRFTSGLPDIHGCLHGRAVYLEVKAPGGKTTELQAWHLAQFSLAGGCVGVVECIEDAERILRREGLI